MKRLEDIDIRFFAVLLVDVLNPLFVISIALFTSVGYLLTLLMPVTIDLWQALFWVCTGVPLILLLARAYAAKRQSVPAQAASWRVVLPFAVPMLVLAPGVYVILSSPTLQIQYHPDIHFGYINQLLYDAPALENVFLAGYPANYYWLYHAYEAAIIQSTALRAPYIASFLNVAAMFSALLWIAQTLVLLKLGKARTFYLGVLTVFVYCAVNATGILSLLAHLINGTFEPYNLKLLLFDDTAFRLHDSLTKIINISTMNLGIAIFAAVLFCCVKILKGKLDLLGLVVISACGIAGLAVFQLATLYIVVILLGGMVVTALLYLLHSPDRTEQVLASWQEIKSRVPPMALFFWFALSLILSLPLLKYNSDISYNAPYNFGFELFNQVNAAMLGGALFLLLPLFVLQWIFVLQKGEITDYFIQMSGLIGLVFASCLVLYERQYDYQYKGIYFLAVLIAISVLSALARLQNSDRNHWRRVGWAIAAILFILTFSRILYLEHYLLHRPQTVNHSGFDYDSNHIVHSDDRNSRFSAYYWLRDNTPRDSIVVIPIGSFVYSNVLMERVVYVKKTQYSFTNNTDYDERVAEVRAFYREDMPLDDYRAMRRNLLQGFPGRAIYAVVKDAEVSPQAMAERGAELVYEHEGGGANVYWLNPMLGV